MAILKTKSIFSSIMIQLDKDIKDITQDDLKKIKIIDFNALGINNVYQEVFFEDILNLPNLEQVNLYSMIITEENLKYLLSLKSLKRLQFNNCEFVDGLDMLLELLVEELLFYNCNKIDYSVISQLSNIKVLHLVSSNIGDLSFISRLTNLIELNIMYSNISDYQILNTDNYLFIKIDIDAYNSNKEVFDILVNKDIVVYGEDGIYPVMELKQ